MLSALEIKYYFFGRLTIKIFSFYTKVEPVKLKIKATRLILPVSHCSWLKCSNQRSVVSGKPNDYKLVLYSMISEALWESSDKLWIKRDRLTTYLKDLSYKGDMSYLTK